MTTEAVARVRYEYGYLSVAAPFAIPGIKLLESPTYRTLIAGLLSLKPHDVKPESIQFVQGDGLLRGTVQCTLGQATGKVSMERVEFEGWTKPDQFGQAMEAALALLRVAETTMEVEVGSIESDLGLHGRLEGGDVGGSVTRFVTNRPAIGRSTAHGAGVTFYFGETDAQLNSVASLDLSAGLPGGLFVRRRVVWKRPGDKSSLVGLMETDLAAALDSLGVPAEPMSKSA